MANQGIATGNARQRIMIVEDNHAIAQAIQIVLQREGYETKWCEDDSVYAEIREWKPDLILMDLKMPRLDGGTVTYTLKTNPDTRAIPVIIVTADNVTDERLVEMKANDLLTKPFQVRRLLERIRHWLPKADPDRGGGDIGSKGYHRTRLGGYGQDGFGTAGGASLAG